MWEIKTTDWFDGWFSALCAGNKAGNEKRFYDQMIPLADREFTDYLNTLVDLE